MVKKDGVILDLASVVRQSADQIFVIDATSALFLFANDRALRATGYTLDDLRKMTQLDLQVGVTLAEMTVRVAPLRTRDQEVLIDHATYRRKDGSTYDVEHRVQLLDRQDAPVYVVQARELAPPQAGEASDNASSDLYHRMVEDADDGVWIIDAEDRTTYANDATARMLGYSREEMMGMTVYQFLDDEWRARATAGLAERRTGARQRMDVKYIRKDGTELWAIMSAAPLFNECREYVGAYAIITDITERKLRELKLQRLQLAGLAEGRPDRQHGQALVLSSADNIKAGFVAKRFALLSDARRLALIELLASGDERSVGMLAVALRMSQPNVSKHLRLLADAGLLARRRQGTSVFYSLADPTVAVLCRAVCQWLGSQAQAELHALAS